MCDICLLKLPKTVFLTGLFKTFMYMVPMPHKIPGHLPLFPGPCLRIFGGSCTMAVPLTSPKFSLHGMDLQIKVLNFY